MANNYYESFVQKLKEIFMMDHAELDFGIYRIMNQKREEITKFLENELLPQVKEVLAVDSAETEATKKRMAEIKEQLGAGIDSLSESIPLVKEYKDLKAKMASTSDGEELQAEVFSHLVTFFSRYYDKGDFMSKRRYKDNTYAIPYNGEEVKLHWANADQYYIKSSEYFRDYTFVLPTSKKKVHFVLKDASTEQNNNKSADNMERRFALYGLQGEGERVLEVDENGELKIYFTYELMPKSVKQDDLMAKAFDEIKGQVPQDFEELLTVKMPTDKQSNRTLLEKHLNDYKSKNSFDYFIHKDLGGFLSRELDFYIKNEVLHIDDLDAKHITKQLTIVRAIKQVGQKIIRMLAQLENFQKRLWLKKKFVVQCDYCITLDHVPQSLYPEIIANEAQRKEWVKLFAIDEIKGDLAAAGYSEPLTEEFLKQNPFLVLDTAFFTANFKHRLLKSIEDLDEQTNGVLINSENFQALQLLQEKYRQQVKCIYLDPPYNTGNDGFIYKDGYSHSSWLAMMKDRLEEAKADMPKDGVIFISIDDREQSNLRKICDEVFGENNFVTTYKWNKTATPPALSTKVRTKYEYVLCYEKNRNSINYNGGIVDGGDMPLLNAGNPISCLLFPRQSVMFKIDGLYEKGIYDNVELLDDITVEHGCANKDFSLKAHFKWKQETLNEEVAAGTTFIIKTRRLAIRYIREGDRIKRPSDVISKVECEVGTNEDAGKELESLFGAAVMSYPKPVSLIKYIIPFAEENKDSIILDFFAGSGTTGHAVINLNREDGGNRKYILVEMAEYFNSVTKPRIEKVIYSKGWNNGKPVSHEGSSHCFKYMRLEQYEDTLNNLAIKQDNTLFEDGSNFKESYMLDYMIDVETRDSLLNMKLFENPFAVTLKTTKDNELVETPVDMVETFNYLIGLNVETMDWYNEDNICVVQGRTRRDNLRALVIWRNVKEVGNEMLDHFFEKMDFRTRDTEFDVIYVNGDNTLPNIRRNEEHWKVVLTEEEFNKRMFEED